MPRPEPAVSPVGSRGAAAAPPFRLPGEHFAAALAFLVVGAGALAWRAPALAAGSFSDAGLIAALHLITLGWISTSIMGALYQFLPVALGASVRWERLAHVTYVAWTTGVGLFVVGIAGRTAGLTMAGAGLLGLAILLFGTNVAVTLGRATRRGLTWWSVAGAVVALVGAWLLGFLLAFNLSSGILGAGRLPVLAIHVHVAAGGWVLLTMVGVSHHLMPMFLLSHGAGDRAGKAAAVLIAVGTAGLLLTEHVLPPAAVRPSLALLAAGTAAFLAQAFLHYRHRRRPAIDPGMRLAGGALVLLALALLAGAVSLGSARPDARLLTAYGVLLVPGALGLFVAGHYYKILPFLTWFHRFGPMASEREVPRVAELFDHRLARIAGGLLVGGIGVTAAGTLSGRATVCLAGGIGFGLGALVTAGQMAAVARSRP